MEVYHQVTLNEWMDMKEQFRRELNNVRTACVRVGYVLRQMEDTKGYEAEGYKSVAEFAEKEHGLKPSTTSRWMSINREYSLDGYSMQLDPRYLGMNASQLTEMLGLPMEDRELITPNTPREDIRELKRLGKMPESPEGFETIVRHFFETNTEALGQLRHAMECGAEEKDLIEIVSPSGNKAYRKDGAMIFLMEQVVKFKRAGHSPEEVQYSELFEIANKIVEEREEEAENGEPAAVKSDEEGPAEGEAEEPEETDESQDGAGQEDVGGTRNEEFEEDAETVEEDTDGEDEEVRTGQQEAAPDEGQEEEFDGRMNQPVDNPAIAPAQKSDLSSKTLNEKPSTQIVDETGKPSPETMSVREYRDLVETAAAKCVEIRFNIEQDADWDAALKALKELEKLLRRLKAEDERSGDADTDV